MNMMNEYFDDKMIGKIIADMEKIVKSGKKGKLYLDNYIQSPEACVDFAGIYESSAELQTLIKVQRENGIAIEIGEEEIKIN